MSEKRVRRVRPTSSERGAGALEWPDAFEFASAKWRKSSYSNFNGACVGVVAPRNGVVGIRDLKEELDPSRVLCVSEAAWRAFLADVKRR
jgi:hypothetical protein